MTASDHTAAAARPSPPTAPPAGRALQVSVRALYPTDVAAYRALRLGAIEETPADFATTYAAESAIALNRLQQRLVHTPFQRVFGAFDGTQLVGMISVKREPIAVLHDRAHLWGVYVAAAARGHGCGHALLTAALDYTASVAELKRVTLMVRSANHIAKRLYQAHGFACVEQADEQGEEQMLLWL
jgi:ribosomal protein S18 acetylase RimI-like enzyme